MAEFKPMSKSDLFLRELLFKAEQGNISTEQLVSCLIDLVKREMTKRSIAADVEAAMKKISEESKKVAKEKVPLVFFNGRKWYVSHSGRIRESRGGKSYGISRKN